LAPLFKLLKTSRWLETEIGRLGWLGWSSPTPASQFSTAEQAGGRLETLVSRTRARWRGVPRPQGKQRQVHSAQLLKRKKVWSAQFILLH